MIKELHKMYDSNTDQFMRSRIQSALKQTKRELTKIQTQYDKFKRYKARTGISKWLIHQQCLRIFRNLFRSSNSRTQEKSYFKGFKANHFGNMNWVLIVVDDN
jgi:hypothetical protein